MASLAACSVFSDSDRSSTSSDARVGTYQCSPGLCVFINNTKFEDPAVKDLPSGKKDEDNLKLIFRVLGFKIQVHRNLIAEDIVSIVKRYSQREHTGAFFLIISSHGGEGDVVYGTNGRKVKVYDLEKHFHATNCPSLAGIPKVFMIDACRGKDPEMVYHATPKGGYQSSASNTMSVPNHADIMTIFGTTQGNSACCNRSEGSYLIQTFVKVLKGDISYDMNLTDIMKKVTELIRAQTAQVQTTFTRHYYITRGTELHKAFELDKAVKQWLPIREKAISETRAAAEKLQKCHRIVNIFTVAGSVTAMTGSILALVGQGLTPLTFGKSFGIFGIGIGLAVIGEVIAPIALTVDIYYENETIKNVQEIYNKDQHLLKHVQEKNEEMQNIEHPIHSNIQYNTDDLVSITNSCAARNLIPDNVELCALVSKIVLHAFKGFKRLLMTNFTISIILNILEINNSLKRGSKTEAIKNLLNHATMLENQMKNINSF